MAENGKGLRVVGLFMKHLVQQAVRALRVGGSDFRWAAGRLLPAADAAPPEQFTPFRFYEDYRAGPPALFPVAAELEALLRERTDREPADLPARGFVVTGANGGAGRRRGASPCAASRSETAS